MNFTTQTVNTLTAIASILAIITFVFAIFAYFINNRRKLGINRRKIRYIPVNFNNDFLDGLSKNGINYSKVSVRDLPDIFEKFDKDESLFEKLPVVYEQLEKYSDLRSEIDFYKKLEFLAIAAALLSVIIIGLNYYTC